MNLYGRATQQRSLGRHTHKDPAQFIRHFAVFFDNAKWAFNGARDDSSQPLIERNIRGDHSKLGLIWDFLKVRKKWWLAPIILFTMLISLLIVLVEGTAVAPFVYTLF